MISKVESLHDPLARDRVVVVGGGPPDRGIGRSIESLYPDWAVTTCETYMKGIAELARRPARAVLAWVNPATVRLECAVAGLREAAGVKTKLVLCCLPEDEPLTRRVLPEGADDYVLYPLERDELDQALEHPRLPLDVGERPVEQPGFSMAELDRIAEMLSCVGTRPMVLIEQLAELVRHALPTRGVTVVVEGAVATSGDVVTKPVLAVPLTHEGKTIGQLNVGEPAERAYLPGDAEKLARLGELASRLLAAASDQRRWRKLAMTDECSGLANRRYLHERLDGILAEATVEKFAVTLLLFDIDDFKKYNDLYGHGAGDEILRVVGELFTHHCREQDVVTRYGGDEFAVVFWDPQGPRIPGSRHPDSALKVLERFRAALASQSVPGLGPSVEGSLTISGGLATYPWDAATRDHLIQRADEALLGAKRAGKNRIFLIGEPGRSS